MRNQQGITLIGMLLVFGSIIVAGVLMMKVIPVYIENYEIRDSIRSLKGLNASVFSIDTETNVVILKNKLINQLSINSVYDLKPEEISVVPVNAQKYLISVKYEVIKPLVYNVSLKFDFDESQEVSIEQK